LRRSRRGNKRPRRNKETERQQEGESKKGGKKEGKEKNECEWTEIDKARNKIGRYVYKNRK
jgi:hypothetical protein